MATMATDEQAIFDIARKIPSAEAREAYLGQVCGDNLATARRVRALLQAYEESASFLESPAAPLNRPAGEPACDDLGTAVGPYKLLQQIGEGGMGTVWMAEQMRPVQRKVALKIIKPGMDSKQVVARFEAERQALALMDHPSIARVLDAGATENGRSYFVMELVKGQPITKYCDEHHLTPRQRLQLFLPLCHAIQHAHQKGIIHRDIKPSNVLVAPHDGEPVVKVIDFGVAKAMGQRLTDHTLFTEFGQVVGTLEYMSPEQAELNNVDIDTRSDVYSLGVLLYELLTGSTPLDRERLKSAAFSEMLRLIREEEPPRPSTRLLASRDTIPALAARRRIEPEKLTRLVRGELDWIVMKALEKDRNRRYETANGFAQDVQRYLSDEPVQACPPSAWYRLRKFARRHRAGSVIAGMALLFLMLLGAGAGWMVRDRAEREEAAARERADRQRRLDEEVSRALDEAQSDFQKGRVPEAQAALKRAEGLLSGSENAELGKQSRELRSDLDVVARLEEIRLEPPELDPANFDFAGIDAAYHKVFRDVGLDLAALDAKVAAEVIRQSNIRDSWVTALDDWAWLKGHFDRPGRDRLLAVARLADADEWRNKLREASARLDTDPSRPLVLPSNAVSNEALLTLRGLATPDKVSKLPPATALILARALLRSKAGTDLAIEVLRTAHRTHPADLWLNWELAQVLWRRSVPVRMEEAVGFLRAAQALRPQHAALHVELARLEFHLGRADQVIGNSQKAVTLRPGNAAAFAVLGDGYFLKGAWNEAASSYQECLRLDADQPGVVRQRLGRALVHQRAWQAAIAAFDESTRHRPVEKSAGAQKGLTGLLQLTSGFGPRARSATTLEFDLDHAATLLVVGDTPAYRKHCDLVLKSRRNELTPRLNYLMARLFSLAPGGPADAALAMAHDAAAGEPNAWHLHTLGVACYRAGQYEEAIVQLTRSLEAGPDWPGRPCNWLVLAMAQQRLGRVDEAGRWLHTARAWMQKARPGMPSAEIGPLPGLACHDWLAYHLLHREALGVVRNEKLPPVKGGSSSVKH